MKNWSIKNNNYLIKNLSSHNHICIYDGENINYYNYLQMLSKKRYRGYANKKSYNKDEIDSLRDSNSHNGNIVEENLRNLLMYKFKIKEFCDSYFNYKFYYYLSIYKNEENDPIIIFNREDDEVTINKNLKYYPKKNEFLKGDKILKPKNNIFKDSEDNSKYEIKVEKIEFDLIGKNKNDIIFKNETKNIKNIKEKKNYKKMKILFPEDKKKYEIEKKSIIISEIKINDGEKKFKNQFLRNLNIINETFKNKDKKIYYLLFINSEVFSNKILLNEKLSKINKNINVFVISILNLKLFGFNLKKKENYKNYYKLIDLNEKYEILNNNFNKLSQKMKKNNKKINEKIDKVNEKIDKVKEKIDKKIDKVNEKIEMLINLLKKNKEINK